jgi:hypothetical protein
MPEVDRHLVVAVGRDAVDVAVPGLARVGAQLVLALAGQEVEGADHVLGRERLAVMPLHALLELEGQGLAVGAPRPRLGELGHDRLRAVLCLRLIVDDQVVEHPHHRDDRRVGRRFMDRQGRRVVAVVHLQDASALLSERNAGRRYYKARRDGGHQ